MLMKDYFNLRKSTGWHRGLQIPFNTCLYIFALLAMMAGGVSPAWAETLTETFDEVTVTSRYLLSNGWVMVHSNGNYQGFGGSYDYQIKAGNYDGETGKSLSCDYSDNNEYVVIPIKLTGTFTYNVKRSSSSNGTVAFFEATKDGDNFTVTSTQLATTSTSSSWSQNSFDLGDGGKYVAIRLLKSRIDQITATIYEEASGPAFVVKEKDGVNKLTSPYSCNFGIATAGTTKEFTLSNPGKEALDVSVEKTGNFGATLSANSIAAGGEVTLTLTMPTTSGSSVVTITPDAASGIDPFVINVSGTIRDANKIYETLGSKPDGWTTTGTWNFNETSGATTTAWYLSNDARLITPLLTVANDEVFIFEAKGNYEDYHALKVEYSADGTNWTASQTSIEMTSEWQTVTISDIPAGEYYIALHTAYSSIRNFYGGEKVPGANFAINIAEGAMQDFGSVRFGATAEKNYTVTNNGDADLTVTFTDAADFYVPKTVKFTKPDSWSGEKLYMYAYGTSGILTAAWPGDEVTSAAQNDMSQWVYTASLPKGATTVIFNDGSKQTSDISTTEFKYVIGLWLDGSEVKTWQNDDFTVAAGGTATFTVKMVTTTSGAKSGNIALAFDALNATSFTIPCKGNVKDENLLIVDFEDGQIPAEWQKGADWDIATASGNSYAVQSNTKTASALVTTPLNVAEGETLTFKAARNASAYGNVTSLKTRYSTDGGATWSSYVSYNVETSALTAQTVSGIPAGTIILEFFGSNIKLDDIEGFTKTNAAAIALAEGTDAVANGDTKDFGFLNANGTATYTVKNIGNATLKATIAGEGVNVEPASIEVAAGETKDIVVTMVYAEPYTTKTAKMTIDSEDWVGDFVVNFTAELVDPSAFVVDFESGKPAGWYSEAWTFDNGVAYVNNGVEKPMITELLAAESGMNVLSFDAFSTYDSQVLNVYTSADRKEWTLAKACNLTATSQTFTLSALADGNYYIKFGGALATTVDNIKGLKKTDAPAHDLYLVEGGATLPTADITPIDTYTASVKVASLRADEEVTADLYFGDTKVATATKSVATGATETITVEGKAPTSGTFEVYVKVNAGAINDETEKVSVTVADTEALAITKFAPVATAVDADEDNKFTAEFDVTVKNNGSIAFDVASIGINLTDGEGTAYTNVAQTRETVFMVPNAYTTDNAKFFIYRWSTDEDQEWGEFTKIADNLYSADLNGKAKFIVVRKASDASEGFDGAWNQSVDLTAADGACFTFQGWDNKDGESHHYFTAGDVDLPNNATLKLKLAVTAPAGDGGNLAFKAQENKTNTWWNDGYGTETVTVKVTAATIVLDETVGTVLTGTNRKVQLKHSFVEGWNTICLPFSIEAYRIHMQAKALAFTDYDSEKNELTFSPVTTLEAGKPYVIYVPAAITEPLEFTGVTIASTKADKAEFKGVTFQGTYAPMAAGSLEGKWGLTAAGRIANAKNTTTMKGFRAYFDGISVGATARFLDDLTGISTITADGVAVEGVYNLQGQKVEQMKKGGLYIINGKKVKK